MKKYLTVFSSFILMLCLGSVYTWSLYASELKECCQVTVFQSQLVFSLLIGLFPLTMVFVGQMNGLKVYRILALSSGILFLSGYLISSFSGWTFLRTLVGIGILGGIATGLGYWVSIVIPVMWFPDRKGLITGIVTAAFGLGAFVASKFASSILQNTDILTFFRTKALIYGMLIMFFSQLIFTPPSVSLKVISFRFVYRYIQTKVFRKAFAGIFSGTFAGLIIIGSLAILGKQLSLSPEIIALSVGLFAIANFSGRVVWGWLSDKIGITLTILLSLTTQTSGIIVLSIFNLSEVLFVIFTLITGLGFGGNFVLFARYTAERFGIEKFGTIYPYVFLGYALAGLLGPSLGGFLFDLTETYLFTGLLAATLSSAGVLLYLKKS